MSDQDIKTLGLNPELWDFPKSHSIKAIGLKTDPIQSIVIDILKDIGLTFELNAIQSKLSKNNKYISITVKILLRDAQDVETLYQKLFQHPLIVRAL